MSRRLSVDDSSELDREVGGPRSLTRLLGLFGILSNTAEGKSLAELSAMLGSPKSSLLNLLRPLVSEGYLIHEASMYRLGPSMYRLAAGVLSNWDFPTLIRPFMVELAERTRETVLLGVMNREAESLTYVEVIDCPHPIRYHIAVGTTRTLYASASGRLLLAYEEKAWCNAYLSSVAFKVKTATPVTRTALKKDLEAIRRNGVSCTIDLYSKGLSAVSAPVFNATGKCVASLTIAGPTERFRSELTLLTAIVQDVAAKASGIVVT
jgi:DNA-binding IclR family transcriptional regulator